MGKNIKLKCLGGFLVLGLFAICIPLRSFADPVADAKAKVKICKTEATGKPLPPVNGVPSPYGGPIDEIDRRDCVSNAIDELKKARANKNSCDKSCRDEIDAYIDRLKGSFSIGDSQSEIKTKEECDSIYVNEKDQVNQCKNIDYKKANACVKSAPSDDGLMSNETVKMATPLLSMVSGADTLYGLYTAMNDKPGCRLSRSDFASEKDKLETQKKDLEDKIKKAAEDAETAQSDFAAKLKEWTDQEGKIADRLEAIPAEKAESKDKLDSENVKIKMQEDSKYNQVVDQMGELRRKYNEIIDARNVAMAKSSEFAFHDYCSEVAVGNDPSKQKPSAQASAAVQAQFSGAFAQGKAIQTKIQKRYDSCMNEKRAGNTQVVNSFANELNSIKSKLQQMQSALGQISDEKRLAEQEINKQIAKLAASADTEIKTQARNYQKIQADKSNEQALLKQKLERLNTESKKAQQQLAILGMKLQAFGGQRPPKTSDDKSMDDMLAECGASFLHRVAAFKDSCCEGKNYTGDGKTLCKTQIEDFTFTMPKETDDEKKASAEARKKERAKARATH